MKTGGTADMEADKLKGELNQLTTSLIAKCITTDEHAISIDEPLDKVLSKGVQRDRLHIRNDSEAHRT